MRSPFCSFFCLVGTPPVPRPGGVEGRQLIGATDAGSFIYVTCSDGGLSFPGLQHRDHGGRPSRSEKRMTSIACGGDAPLADLAHP